MTFTVTNEWMNRYLLVSVCLYILYLYVFEVKEDDKKERKKAA
jgi:hypothetical protein